MQSPTTNRTTMLSRGILFFKYRRLLKRCLNFDYSMYLVLFCMQGMPMKRCNKKLRSENEVQLGATKIYTPV